eukprot:GFUD01113551.1.p1 GENE.GFUD01113551.1~~GFUD01113551.1.p1  ORF type:complete len:204 (+),score=44.15 GFUD01113551.1:66-677(+)
MVSIIPEQLKESEKNQNLSERQLEKLLLERLLLRKDLRLQSMQDRLDEQQKCIADKEEKIELINGDLEEIRSRNVDMKRTLENHRKLPGFNAYMCFTKTANFSIDKFNIFTTWICLILCLIIQVLMFIVCKFPSFVCIEATWVLKQLAGRYIFVNQPSVENFKNECLELYTGNDDNSPGTRSRKKKYYKNGTKVGFQSSGMQS